MEFMDVIRQRRSVRAYEPDPIPQDVLDEILEAGRIAPSGGNSQNWFFGVVRDPDTKMELAKASGPQLWIAQAPVVLALCARVDTDLRELDDENFRIVVEKYRFGEDFVGFLRGCEDQQTLASVFEVGSLLIAGTHMTLAAENRGLRSCWIGFLDIRKASEILALPKGVACLFLLPMGRGAEEPKPIERKTIDDIVFHDRWKQ